MTKVKICGLKTVEDVGKVNPYRPDYVGFVFAPGSKRRVSWELAKEMKGALAPGILAVGVFVNQEIRMIAGLVRAGIIDLVQLHGDEGKEDILELTGLVDCPVIKAVPVGHTPPVWLPQGADYLLFDTAAQERGGTGRSFDWSLLGNITAPYFLAGGIHEGNVAEAMAATQPYAVDVSSGVETNGVKDEDKIRRLIRRVRAET